MKDILQTMYDMLSANDKQSTLLFINFSKPQIERIGCKNATCIYIAENEEQKIQVEKNINRRNEMYDTVMTFETGKGKNVVNNLEVWMENKKFDGCIMNPPFSGKGYPLYLKIFDAAKKYTDEIVLLCPTQWVKGIYCIDCVQKARDNNKFVKYEDVGHPFKDAKLSNSCGVFYWKNNEGNLTGNDIVFSNYRNPNLTKSIFNKYKNFRDNIGNHCDRENVKVKNGYWVNIGPIRGNVRDGIPCWDWTTLFSEEYHTNFKYEVSKDWNHIKFKSIAECQNFIKTCENDLSEFCYYLLKKNNNIDIYQLDYVPWFGDYTHEWTEDMIQKELGLTDEEVNYIHEEMKEFGWKTRK